MAINRVVRAALKKLSTAEIDIVKNYEAVRFFNNITHPSIRKPGKTFDSKIILDDCELPVRIFTPKHRKTNEVILFFHGGGWISGSLDSYTKTCYELCKQTGRLVISVAYRLAPEFPFPFALEDCYRAARAIYQNQAAKGTKADNIILVGDSAGGNLAAAVSLMAAELNEFKVEKQILIYPVTYNDHSTTSPFPSVKENGTDYLLTAKNIIEYTELYVQDEKNLTNPYFAPLVSEDLSNQPKTLIITAQYDPLRDEGEAYGEKLKKFGNQVQTIRISDALHGFISLPARFSQVKKCYNSINLFLDEVETLENKLEQT